MKTPYLIYIDSSSSIPLPLTAMVIVPLEDSWRVLFAIIWVLVGLVIASIFKDVTTSLTAITLSTDVKLYGTKVSLNELGHDFSVLLSSSSLSVDRRSSPTGSVSGSAHDFIL